jgi:hypothetical protein
MAIIENEAFAPGPRHEAHLAKREQAIIIASRAAYEDFRARHNATEIGTIKPKRPWEDLPQSSQEPIIADTRAAIAAYEAAINTEGQSC